MASCPICGRPSIDKVFRLFDDRYGFAGYFWLMRCHDCDHRFLDGAHFSDSEIQALYSDYYPRRSMGPEDYCPHEERSGFGAWFDGAKASSFRWVPPHLRVLDIGCGFGQALGYHANRGCEVWGVEADESIRRIADLHGFRVRVGVFKPEDFPPDYFDVVTMDQVIEHMRDPVATMAGIRAVLKTGGVAILSTPNAQGWGAKVFGRRWINWHAPYHLHFFSRGSMAIAAKRVGLEFRSLGTITPSAWLHYQLIHLATRREPQQASPFWSGKGKYTLSDRIALKGASLLHRSRLTHLATRAFDATGLGDSQLFELRKA